MCCSSVGADCNDYSNFYMQYVVHGAHYVVCIGILITTHSDNEHGVFISKQ
jgi:hypothetical protein